MVGRRLVVGTLVAEWVALVAVYVGLMLLLRDGLRKLVDSFLKLLPR